MNLFGSSDKSNFIQNMNIRTLNKMISGFMLIMCAAVCVAGALYLFDSGFAYLGSTMLSIFGFGGIILYLIAVLKKQVSPKNSGFILMAALTLLAAVSTIFALDRESAIYGITGRYEGLLALASYFGVFLLGSAYSDDGMTRKLLIAIAAIAAANAVVGVLQFIPALDFPSYYKNLYSIGLEGVYTASGFTGSPIFLCTMLTIGLAVTASGACFKKEKRPLCLALSAVLIVAGTFTRSIAGPIGFAAVIAIMAVIGLIRKERAAVVMSLILAAFTTVLYILLYAVGPIDFMDKAIAFEDSFYRCFTTGALTSRLENFYAQVWGGSILTALEYPLTGAGPDCLILDWMAGVRRVANTFDKSYNEFLYIAATRGIPSLIAYLGFVAVTIKKAIAGVKGFVKDGSDLLSVALMAIAVAYIVQSLVNVSVITVAPYFWAVAGIIHSRRATIK